MRLDRVGINYYLNFKEIETFIDPFYIENAAQGLDSLQTRKVPVQKLINLAENNGYYITDNASFNEIAEYFLLTIGFPRRSLYTFWFSLSNDLHFVKEVPKNCLFDKRFQSGSNNVAPWFDALSKNEIEMQLNVYLFTGVGVSFKITAKPIAHHLIKEFRDYLSYFTTRPDLKSLVVKNESLANIYTFFPSLIRDKINLRIRTINFKEKQDLIDDIFLRFSYCLTFVDPDAFPVEKRYHILPSTFDPKMNKLASEVFLKPSDLDKMNDEPPIDLDDLNDTFLKNGYGRELMEKMFPEMLNALDKLNIDPFNPELTAKMEEGLRLLQDDLKNVPDKYSAEQFIEMVEIDFQNVYQKFLEKGNYPKSFERLERIKARAYETIENSDPELKIQIDELYSEIINKPGFSDPDNYN
ncbi:Uncharacterised protein [Metamycoplasma arthritidis]|uniref:Uncharacterized protein n=1 Tax=Metamycoplasma arthritidis (strain 158L3-1) TaxID=243272 RepID=B3PMT6_META1|nr:hypothetical protein [Metamycoplasma arthritidis]ACF07338.1 hypothetical protein MARTH_orf519 [Metamycoplasma arthritidis 158L3-1]VEU78861.1 Uncharacterised protein [Metamycoplasma arthritidis]